MVVYFLTGNIFRIGQQALIVRLEENQKDKEKNKEKNKEKEDQKENDEKKEGPVNNTSRKKRKKKEKIMSNKWVEVEAKTIDDAIKAGLKELQLDDATEADISILREPEGGVFGVGNKSPG